jgi:hypothetical protein
MLLAAGTTSAGREACRLHVSRLAGRGFPLVYDPPPSQFARHQCAKRHVDVKIMSV